MDNFIKPFMLKDGLFKGQLVRAGGIMDEIVARRDYPPMVAEMLAEVTVLAALLSYSLKYDGIFTLQIKADKDKGAVSDLAADITSKGKVRAYAKYDKERLAKITPEAVKKRGSVPALLGAGYMVFTIDHANGTERYQGMVELEGHTLAECAMAYFRRSEQINTIIKIAAGKKAKHWYSGGIMLQQMPASGGRKKIALTPEEIADEWQTDAVLLASITDKELTDTKLKADEVIYRLYHEQDITVYPQKKLGFSCRCSKERIKAVLATLPKDELAKAAKNGKIEITCEFCGNVYSVDEKEIK